jgi:hypothetical protein
MRSSRPSFFAIVVFVLLFIVLVKSAPKSSALKRLAEQEAAADAIGQSSSSSAAPARGSRQRLQTLETAATDAAATPFTDSLKRDWASGAMSAKKVQQLALDALGQGAHSLDSLAGAGTEGKYTQNVHRSLLKIFGHPVGAPDIDWINIPGKDGAIITQPFLMPHKFFASLYNSRPNFFYKHLRGPEGAPREYWEELKNNRFVTKHPLLSNFDTCFPLGLHGDAGAFTKHDSLMVISWNGLLGRDCGKTKRIVFTFVRKRDYSPATLDRIWEIFAWSVNSMARGTFPTIDYDRKPIDGGGPLAGPFTGVLTQIRGDWQFYVEIFGFPPWNGAIRMCWLCRASGAIKSLAFTDCRNDANWRNTRWTDESWRAHMRAMALSIPVLLLLVIGLRLECISIDSLHALDLGFASHVAGNTFWEGIQRKVWGKNNQDDNVVELEKDMKTWCKANKISSRIQGQLTKERIRTTTDSGYPKLKAKGAQTRHLMPYCLALAQRFQRFDPTFATHDLLIVGVNKLICDLYDLMMGSGRFFSEAAKAKIVVIGNQLPQLYMRLYKEAYDLGLKAWKMTPKLHLIQELLLFQCLEWGNPLYYWCYGDEDLVGSMIEIARSCHMTTLTVTALVKWLVLSFDCDMEADE